MVYARLYLETGDPHQAEDLVQETYLRAYRSIRKLAEPKGFHGWLGTIARSVAVDSWRRAGRQKRGAPARLTESALETVAASEGEEAGRGEMREKVRLAIQSLPEEYRVALMMRYIDGADYGQITMQLGLTGDVLRGLLYRGLQLLRRAVKTEVTR